MRLTSTRRARWRAVPLVAASLLLATVFAACGGDGDAEETTPATETAPEAVSDEPIALEIWFVDGDDMTKVIEELNGEFQEKYPNVTFDVQTFPHSELGPRSRLAFGGDSPPDAAQIGINPSAAGDLFRAGAFRNLQEYADQYGWEDRFDEGALRWSRFESDGTWGSGDLYSLAQVWSPLGVFYNKAKLNQLGLSLPTTFSEFEQLLADVKAAGETPLMVGNADQWPGLHVWFSVANQIVGRDAIRSIIFQEPGATFEVPGMAESLALVQRWAEEGYFNEDFNAVGYDDSIRRFTEGEGFGYVTGPWISQTLYDAIGDEVGFFLVPPEDDSWAVTNSINWPIFISSKTEHPDILGEWLDFISGPRAAELLVRAGSIPAMRSEGPLPEAPNTLFAEILEAGNKVAEEDATVWYFDAATGSMYDVMAGGFQEVVVGRRTPEDFIAAMERDLVRHTGPG